VLLSGTVALLLVLYCCLLLVSAVAADTVQVVLCAALSSGSSDAYCTKAIFTQAFNMLNKVQQSNAIAAKVDLDDGAHMDIDKCDLHWL
jgi:hypothetical protein